MSGELKRLLYIDILYAKHVFSCDLMESEIEKLPVSHGTVAFEVKPFEIITLKVRF